MADTIAPRIFQQLLTASEIVPQSNYWWRISKFTCDYRLRQSSIRESNTRAEYWGL